MLFKAGTILVCFIGVYLISSGGQQQVEAQSNGSLSGILIKILGALGAELIDITRIVNEFRTELSENNHTLIERIGIVTKYAVRLARETVKIVPVIIKIVGDLNNGGNQPKVFESIVGDGTASNSPLGQSLSSITNLVGKLLDSLDTLLSTTGVAASLASSSVLSLVDVLLDSFGSLVGAALTSAGQLLSAGNDSLVVPLIQLLNSLIGTSLSSVVDQIKTLSTNSSGLLDTVGAILNSTLTQVQSLIGQLTDASSSTLRTALTDLASTITGLIQTISNETSNSP